LLIQMPFQFTSFQCLNYIKYKKYQNRGYAFVGRFELRIIYKIRLISIHFHKE